MSDMPIGADARISDAPFDSGNATLTPQTAGPSTLASIMEISGDKFPSLKAPTPATATKPPTKTAKGKGKKKHSSQQRGGPSPRLRHRTRHCRVSGPHLINGPSHRWSGVITPMERCHHTDGAVSSHRLEANSRLGTCVPTPPAMPHLPPLVSPLRPRPPLPLMLLPQCQPLSAPTAHTVTAPIITSTIGVVTANIPSITLVSAAATAPVTTPDTTATTTPAAAPAPTAIGTTYAAAAAAAPITVAVAAAAITTPAATAGTVLPLLWLTADGLPLRGSYTPTRPAGSIPSCTPRHGTATQVISNPEFAAFNSVLKPVPDAEIPIQPQSNRDGMLLRVPLHPESLPQDYDQTSMDPRNSASRRASAAGTRLSYQRVAKINPKRVPIDTEVLLQVYFSMIANLVRDARFEINPTNRHRNNSALGALRIRSSFRSTPAWNPILMLMPNNVPSHSRACSRFQSWFSQQPNGSNFASTLLIPPSRAESADAQTGISKVIRCGAFNAGVPLSPHRFSGCVRCRYSIRSPGFDAWIDMAWVGQLVLVLVSGSAYAPARSCIMRRIFYSVHSGTRWIFAGEMEADLRWGDARRESELRGFYELTRVQFEYPDSARGY
ncbi:hypothetical protein B0H17DRAFT_1127253 [Mycena rosella]|uniref:Uncharacterized protein n=1 Tax=Mycena rosella TaxID=1033263 RepID=A0AAD7GRG7_MYCRO|nr:hypothetical protein B0H17DRAFT_1127253 [Mycena rosella]